MWKITEKKVQSTYAELKVSAMVKEMREMPLHDSKSFISKFNNDLQELKDYNGNRTLTNLYRATYRNHYSLEIWKMTANGDFNYCMFLITKSVKQ